MSYKLLEIERLSSSAVAGNPAEPELAARPGREKGQPATFPAPNLNGRLT